MLNWQYYKTSNTGLPEDALLSVLAAAGNWVGTKTQGLVCVGSNPKIGPYNILNTGNSQLASNKITVICQDRNNAMWIGTDHGIQKMVGDTTFTSYNTGNSGLGGDMITSMTFDSRNTIYVGTEGGGFSVFDGSSWSVYTASTSSLPGNDVNDIYIDNTGRILISTVNGLATVRF